MGELPEGLGFRAPVDGDLDAVFAVLEAGQVALHGEADLTRADLDADWARPSFDLGRDAVVVEDGGEVVAYVECVNGRIDGGVHPGAQGRGVGGWLLGWGVGRARDGNTASAEVTAPDTDLRLGRLLSTAGFDPKWESWLFWQSLSAQGSAPTGPPLADVQVPAGLHLRNPDLDADARSLYDLIEPAFLEWPDREPTSFEDWKAQHLDHGDLEVATSWLLEDSAGAVVGAALSLTDRGWGWLSELAVRHDHRRAGLGSVLLQQCLHSYRHLGLHTGGLGTDSRTGARDLYERNGFAVQRSFTRWSLPLK